MKKTKTFKSGNSVAVRLPKTLGIEAGVEMTVREERGRYIVEPVEQEPKKIDLTGIYGSCAGLRPLTDEEREIDSDLDWDGKLLDRE
ncbi:MAG: AbrB/MazE/SpoVT family DNA-binding domain-containing protein [Allosphingosinicella sp.]